MDIIKYSEEYKEARSILLKWGRPDLADWLLEMWKEVKGDGCE